MDYPENIIKGIPNKDCLIEGRIVGSNLFHFNQPRDDGGVEQSINWEDDESVVDLTLNQRKADGELQFKEGVARLPRSEIDRLNERPTISGLISYERSPLDGNPHHGNLLLQVNVPKQTMKLIAAGLAIAISDIITQNREHKPF